MAGRGQSGADHRALHELEVTGSGVPLDREILLEVTHLKIQVGDTCVTDYGILKLGKSVGQIHIKLSVPFLVNLSFDSETGTADLCAVSDSVSIIRSAEEHCSVGLCANVKP